MRLGARDRPNAFSMSGIETASSQCVISRMNDLLRSNSPMRGSLRRNVSRDLIMRFIKVVVMVDSIIDSLAVEATHLPIIFSPLSSGP